MLERAATGIGVSSVIGDEGIVRCYPLIFLSNGTYFPRFELEILRVLEGRSTVAVAANPAGVESVMLSPQKRLATDWRGCLWPRFPARNPIPRISIRQLLEDPATGARLKDRVVILGSTATGLSYVWFTPLGVGHELLWTAWAFEAMSKGYVLNRPNTSNTVEAFLTLVAALLAAVLRGRWPLVAGIAAAAAALGVSAWAFLGYGFLFDGFVPALAALVMSAITPVLWRFSTKPAANSDAAG